jgi:hypothetical protein
MKPLHLSEEMGFTTVRLEGHSTGGGVSTGTGFLYCVAAGPGRETVAIVTNKHVFATAATLEFHVCVADASGDPISGRYYTLQLSELQNAIISHPNPDIDLCALPCAGMIAHAQSQGARLFFRCFNRSHLPSATDEAGFAALEPILMVGYPNGLWDRVNNRPLFRRGVTATQPSIDLNGRGEFLIDAACFPGSSGSPVMLWREPGYMDRFGNIQMTGTKPKLLGALYGGPVANVAGELVLEPAATPLTQRILTDIPINLGLVVKSRYIVDLEPEIVRIATRTA